MKYIKPLRAIKQPLLWRQAISQSKFGHLGWKNFYCYPLTKWWFSFKNHESALFDHVIIGSNPIITQCLLIKLYNEVNNHNEFKGNNKSLKIGIYFTGNDYWSYHLFENKETWNFLEKSLGIDLGHNFSEFCIKYKHIFQQLNITLIYSENNSISYYQKDEKYSKGYVFHLKQQEYIPNSFEVAMPHVNLAENQIRLRYLDQYYSYLNSMSVEYHNVQKLHYSNKMQANKDSEEKTHLLLSDNISLTSLAYWLNCTTSAKEVQNYENNTYYSTHFEHAFNSTSYGTAIHTANDFESLEHQSLEDFITLFKN